MQHLDNYRKVIPQKKGENYHDQQGLGVLA
jgi:hypothetical protein